MSWLRLEAATFHDPGIRRCKPFGGVVFVALLTMSKLHGWGGGCPSAAIDGQAIAEHLGLPESMAPEMEKAVETLLAAGVLARVGNVIVITEWRRYQIDPTGAARQRRYKATRHRSLGVVTVGNGVPRDVTAMTATGRDVDVKDRVSTVVDVDVDSPRAREDGGHVNGGREASPPAAQGTAPGGKPATASVSASLACSRCHDGLRHPGTAAARCCTCPRGRERARLLRRAVTEDDLQAKRAAVAAALAHGGRRGGDPAPLAALLPRLPQRQGSAS